MVGLVWSSCQVGSVIPYTMRLLSMGYHRLHPLKEKHKATQEMIAKISGWAPAFSIVWWEGLESQEGAPIVDGHLQPGFAPQRS